MVHSFGAPVVSTKVYTLDPASSEPVVTEIAAGDTLDSVVLKGIYENQTFENVTVVGFTLGTLDKVRNTDTILDGVPVYRRDDMTGGPVYGVVEETTRIAGIVGTVPGETENDPEQSVYLPVDRILQINGEPVIDAAEDEDAGEEEPGSGDGDGE